MPPRHHTLAALHQRFLEDLSDAVSRTPKTTWGEWQDAVEGFLATLKPWLHPEDFDLPPPGDVDFDHLPGQEPPFSAFGYAYFRAWLRRRGIDPEAAVGAATPTPDPKPVATFPSVRDLPRDPRALARFFAIVTRNALEEFHKRHLTDAQMRELNPIVRSAGYTALHALLAIDRSVAAREWVAFQAQYIPSYWEEPVLLPGYINSLARRGEKPEDLTALLTLTEARPGQPLSYVTEKLAAALRAQHALLGEISAGSTTPKAEDDSDGPTDRTRQARRGFQLTLQAYLALHETLTFSGDDRAVDGLLALSGDEFDRWLTEASR